MKKFIKITLIITAVIALLSLLVGAFDWAAQPVAKVLNKPVEWVKSVARTIAAVAIGVLVILAAISTIAGSPIIGTVLLLVGIGTVVTSLWGVFSSGE